MASTESGRQMYPSFKEAHEAFVADALRYQDEDE